MKLTRFTRRSLVVATSVCLAVSLTACGSSSDAGKSSKETISKSTPVTINVGGFPKVPVYWPMFGAQALGFTKDQNLTIKLTTFNDEPSCMRAIVGGSMDACFVGADTVARSAQSGAKAKIVAANVDPTVSALNVDPKKVKSWDDLRGKTIAAQTPDAGTSVAIKALLMSHGVDPADVNFLNVGGSTPRYAALRAGKVAAAITSQPDQFKAAEAGYPILGTSQEAGQMANYLAALPSGSATHNEGLRRMVRVMQQADDWLAKPENKPRALELFASEFGFEPKYADKTYDLLVEQGHYTQKGTDVDMASLKRILEITDKYTGSKLSADPDALVDRRYLEE